MEIINDEHSSSKCLWQALREYTEDLEAVFPGSCIQEYNKN